MPDLKEFRLGIIGGCLSHQSDIPHSLLFHRQLDRMLQERQGIRLKVAITRHFDRDYTERLEALLEEADVDGVLLHLRAVVVGKSVLLVNRLEDGKRYYRLHPFLFKQYETGWNKRLTSEFARKALFVSREPSRSTEGDEDPFEHPTPSRKIFGFRLRTLNLLAGMLLGLDNWAMTDEFEMFYRFKDACDKRGMPFFVLGPTPVTTYSVETRLWRKMNNEMCTRFPKTGVPHCLLEQLTNEAGQDMLQGDGLHLNEAGHAHVARRLDKTMMPWIKNIQG
jgi:hypothetical protein